MKKCVWNANIVTFRFKCWMQFSKLLAKRKSSLPVTIKPQDEETTDILHVGCKNTPCYIDRLKTKKKEEVHGLSSYVSKQPWLMLKISLAICQGQGALIPRAGQPRQAVLLKALPSATTPRTHSCGSHSPHKSPNKIQSCADDGWLTDWLTGWLISFTHSSPIFPFLYLDMNGAAMCCLPESD